MKGEGFTQGQGSPHRNKRETRLVPSLLFSAIKKVGQRGSRCTLPLRYADDTEQRLRSTGVGFLKSESTFRRDPSALVLRFALGTQLFPTYRHFVMFVNNNIFFNMF